MHTLCTSGGVKPNTENRTPAPLISFPRAAALLAGVPVPDPAGAPDGGGWGAGEARRLLPAARQPAGCSDGGQAGEGGAAGVQQRIQSGLAQL